jgi:hypothetical protein
MLVPRLRLLVAAACLTVFAPVGAHQDAGGEGKPKPKPSVVYTLVAVNDLGYRVQLDFLYRSDADIWGVACSGECKSENVFHVYRSKL